MCMKHIAFIKSAGLTSFHFNLGGISLQIESSSRAEDSNLSGKKTLLIIQIHIFNFFLTLPFTLVSKKAW